MIYQSANAYFLYLEQLLLSTRIICLRLVWSCGETGKIPTFDVALRLD